MNEDNDKFEGQENNQEEQPSGTYRMTRDELAASTLETGSNSSNDGDADTGSTSSGRTSSNNYSYYEGPKQTSHYTEDGKPRQPKKKNTFGVKVAKAACLGVVFGLTASFAMWGVNKATGSNSTVSENGTNGTIAIVQTSSTGVSTTDAEDVSDIVDSVMPSIVAVNTTVEATSTDWFGRQYTKESQGAGSGIIISEDNGKTLYVMTNYHVIEDATEVSVQFADDTTATADVKGYDEDGDVAVLTIDMSQLTAETKSAIAIAVMGDSDALKAGSSAIAIGNALGYGQSVTTGVISAVEREVQLTDKTMTLVQTSAAINPGNSGGALLNGKGEVIGMNTVKYSDTTVEGMGYAIPINTALETAKGIIDGTIVTKTDETTAYLGITGGTLTEENAEAYNAPAGIYISNVATGSAAERSGLQAGCIITGFNGEDVATMEELQEKIAACAPGDNVTIIAQFPDANGNYTEQSLTTIMGSKSEMTTQTTRQ